jgi:tryptophanyl-tRNA synthetase
MATFLSGIQPSGLPHLGNYFGAIEQHIGLALSAGEHFYFIADYHALTSSRDPAELRERVLEIAVSYVALGLDVSRAVLFRQSDVPEVTELAWMLSCVTPMGLLERAVSYRDKVEKGLGASVGLFTYPVLMAADILAYDSDWVPVGVDQVQHVEMARDMAGAFNQAYGPVFKLPQHRISRHPKVPGLDGAKMSKSYGNTIWVFESGKALAKTVARVVTDSRPASEPKEPGSILLLDLLRLVLSPEELGDWESRVRQGGPSAPGYGHMKQRLTAAIEEKFAPARARRAELLADRGQVERILAQGAERARQRARATRDRALAAAGLR